MQVTNYQDYRSYLKGVLEKRVFANPRYSLRAFARDLKISPQMLSFILNKKKGISSRTAADFAERLELGPTDSSYFLDLVSLSRAKGSQEKKLAQRRIDERRTANTEYRFLAAEAFQAIADWQHYAILELTFIQSFKSDPKWIARRLGISPFEASQALDRLKTLGLLLPHGRDGLRKSDHRLTATFGAPSAALRKLARQLLQKAADSLDSQSIEERDVTNITMAIDPALLPEAKAMIADFRRKLCAFLEQGKRTEVYTFLPALFKITQTEKGN